MRPFGFGLGGWSGLRYYVSNSGNDLLDGRSSATAWQTINKVNNSTFEPGDRVLFNKGDVWLEQLIPSSSGISGSQIKFSSYGSGNKPIIDASRQYTTWIEMVGGGLEVTENFSSDMSNFNVLGGTWVVIGGEVYLDTPQWIGESAINITPTSQSEGQWVKITFGTIPATDDYFGVILRADSINGGNNYHIIYESSVHKILWQTWEDNSPTATLMDSTAITLTSGDVMGVEVTGGGNSTLIKIWKNPVGDTPADWGSADITFDGSGLNPSANTGLYFGIHSLWQVSKTFTASGIEVGSPVINMPGIYLATDAQDVDQLFEDHIPLSKASDKTCTDGEWYYSSTEPNNTYYKPLIGVPSDHLLTYIKPYNERRGCINISNRSYLTFDSLNLMNCEQGIDSVETVTPNNNIIVENCLFTLCNAPILTTNSHESNNLRFINNVFDRCNRGLTLGGTNKYINTYIYDNEFADTHTIDGTNKWEILADYENMGFEELTNSIISKNNVHGGYGYGIYLYSGSGSKTSGNLIFGNIFKDIALAGLKTGGDGTYSIEDNIIAYNIFDNTGTESGEDFVFALYNGSSASINNYLYNNTLYGGGVGIVLFNGSKYFVLKNNIIANMDRYNIIIGSTATDYLLDYNLYDTDTIAGHDAFYDDSERSFVYWKANYEPNSVLGDPKFLSSSDFHLQSDSPAINAGVDVGLTEDYEGNSIVGVPDIGTCEYQP